MAEVDLSLFSGRDANGYPRWYDGNKITSYRLKQWKKLQGGSRRVTSVPKQYGKYFGSGTRFTNRQGHLQKWARPMTATGGTNPNYNWNRVNYRDFNGKIGRTAANQKWGVGVNKGATGGILYGTQQWVRQIQISLHALYINAENFRVVVGRRAIKVFQNSFKYQQFYSNKTLKWPSLAPYTVKKRERRGTGSKILNEYGDLIKSIKLDENPRPMTTRVYTDVVPANTSHHKKYSICYAGYHNEGKGHYGPIDTPYKKRKFMGHSSYLNPYTDSFMRKMMKLYLFDNVFLLKQR